MTSVPFGRLPVRIFTLVALVATLLIGLSLTGPTASAHVVMQGAEPPADSTVETAPATVQVLFSGEVMDTSTLTVAGPDGAVADAGDGGLDLGSLDRNLLTVTLLPALPDGVYTVTFSAVPTDGHEPATGSYTFTVGSGVPEMTKATPAATPGATPAATPGSTPVATPVAVEANVDSTSSSTDGRMPGLIGAALASIVVLGLVALFVIRSLTRRIP